MPKLSAIIICCDEEAVIEECLQSVSWMDEIIVVDSGSQDATLQICRRYTDRIFRIPWQGYGAQKNRALEQAVGEWVFSIDADERITGELRQSILQAIGRETPYTAYRVARRNFFLGRWMRHGGWYPDRQVRLFCRDRSRFEERPVHEKVLTDGPIGDLVGDLLHYTYDNLSEYIERQHRYATLGAEILWRQGRRTSLWSLPWKPLWKFIEVYLYKQGFRDGPEGLVAALLASFFALVRHAKLWEMSRNQSGRLLRNPP